MDPRLLDLYNEELKFIRQQGHEFSQQFPKIAARLNLESFDVVDPYVERLLEGMAFLAARTQLKLQAEFPKLSESLLEQVYPNILAPVPAMGIVALKPDLGNPTLLSCPVVRTGETLVSLAPKGVPTRCTFSVAHAVTLAPIEVVAVSHGNQLSDLPQGNLQDRLKGALRIRMRLSQPDTSWSELPLDHLDFYVGGADEFAYRLVERIFAERSACFVSGGERAWQRLPTDAVVPLGFADDEALLPHAPQNMQGFRLVQEYFGLPHRFNFFRVQGLQSLLKAVRGNELELVIGFQSLDVNLDRQIGVETVQLFCTPVVNVFSRECDRIDLSEGKHEHHLLVDRTRPMDFEVFGIQSVRGYGQGSNAAIDYVPMSSFASLATRPDGRFYAARRDPRLPSDRQRLEGGRTKHLGQETFLSLSSTQVPDNPETHVEQLAIRAWVTNRDLPLIIPVGQGDTDLLPQGGLPVVSIRFLRGPTRPRTRVRDGRSAWRFVQHAALNYLSVLEGDSPDESVHALRQMLGLFVEEDEAALHKQIHGIRQIRTEPCVSRVEGTQRIAFARGLRVTVSLDTFDFQGAGIYAFGAVLNELLRRYVSINSFVQLRVEKIGQEGFFEWRPACGTRPLL